MAINTLFGLSKFLRPGYYWNTPIMYGIPVAEKSNLERWEAVRLHKLLNSLTKLDLLGARNATMIEDIRVPLDNTVYYKITIWENPENESRK